MSSLYSKKSKLETGVLAYEKKQKTPNIKYVSCGHFSWYKMGVSKLGT